MVHAAFDTLSTAQRLEREFDFPTKQAEGTAILLHEHLVGYVATKDDIGRLESRIDGELATKDDIAKLESRIDRELVTKSEFISLEKKVAGLDTRVAGLETRLERLETRVERLEEKVDALVICVGELRNDMKWMKAIGAVIIAALVLPLLGDIAAWFLDSSESF